LAFLPLTAGNVVHNYCKNAVALCQREKTLFQEFVHHCTFHHTLKDSCFNKRKSSSNHSVAEETPRIEDGDYDTSSAEEEEASQATSIGLLLQFWLKS